MTRGLFGHPAITRRRRGHRPAGLFLAAIAMICACTVRIVSGPTTVAVGDTVVYELQLGDNTGFGASSAFLVSDVPEGWQLVSSFYTVVVDGEPVVTEGTEVTTTVCDSQLEEVPAGYQRLRLGGPTFSEPDAIATLEFFVESQPAGEYDLFFAFGGLEFSDCSSPTAISINREPGHFLRVIQGLFDGEQGVDGLDEPRQLAMAPDGKHLYVASHGDRTIAALARDPATGELSLVAADSGGFEELPGPRGLAISADGAHLYGASRSEATSGAVTTFVRDPADGELQLFESLADDVETLAISPGGGHVYAASSVINVYARDPESGELSFVATVFSGGGQLALSPDGRHVYAAWSDRIDVYERDGISGDLSLVDQTGGAVDQVILSPDGKHLYAVGGFAVTVFERDATTGALAFVESQTELTGTIVDPVPLVAVAISLDGSHVAVAGPQALAVFQRHPGTGVLTIVDSLFSGNLLGGVIGAPGALAFSPDGRHLYAVQRDDDAVVAIETAILFFDSFESGDVSAWPSATEP